MIVIESKTIEKWFSTNIVFSDIFRFLVYKQAYSTKRVFGFKRIDFFTKIIDLSQDIEIIRRDFRKNTKYEINKATKEGIEFSICSNIKDFIVFYNDFAKSKNKERLNESFFSKYLGSLVITQAIDSENKSLVMHSYLCDKDNKRVRLLHSASLFRSDDQNMRSLVGMANRFLHFKDMTYFKDNNYMVYDFGGYAFETNDEQLKNINDFKDSFGGTLIHESDYMPLILFVIIKIKNIWKD